jgi:hypothetical protein
VICGKKPKKDKENDETDEIDNDSYQGPPAGDGHNGDAPPGQPAAADGTDVLENVPAQEVPIE